MNELKFKNNEQLNTNSFLSSTLTLVSSKIDKKSHIININNNNNLPKERNNMFISEEIRLDDIESELKILEFEKLIHGHGEQVKFLLILQNGFYLSCGNDKLIIFVQDFNVKFKMENLRETLYFRKTK